MNTVRKDYLPFGRPNFSEEEIAAVAAVMRTGWIGMGAETLAFEAELAQYVGAPHVVTVNSCTSALFLSLAALGVGKGDEVICPSLTWCATANVALHLGAEVVFCDVDRDTMCVTIESVLAKVTPRTRAVMVVHYGGLAVDVRALRAALPERVAIIEDAAHALGSRFAWGEPVGSSGNPTCFSFYANKNLSTGEGGAVAVFDDAIAARLRSLRQNGLSADAWKRYSHPQTALVPGLVELGYKMNFIDLQAVIGRVQLRRQGEFAEIRQSIAETYLRALTQAGCGITFQRGLDDRSHAKHLLVAMLPVERMSLTRDAFVLAMRERNLGASIHYAPLHRMPLYGPERQAALPSTEHLASRIVTLPISASMNAGDAAQVAEVVIELIRQ